MWRYVFAKALQSNHHDQLHIVHNPRLQTQHQLNIFLAKNEKHFQVYHKKTVRVDLCFFNADCISSKAL
jgi:hypothetical protein